MRPFLWRSRHLLSIFAPALVSLNVDCAMAIGRATPDVAVEPITAFDLSIRRFDRASGYEWASGSRT